MLLAGTLFRGGCVDRLGDSFLQKLAIVVALGPGGEHHLRSVLVVCDAREAEEVDLEGASFGGGESVPDERIWAGILFLR